MNSKISFQEFHFYLCLLIAFFLPFQSHQVQLLFQAVPLLTVLLIINWIAEGNFKAKFSILLSNKPALIFIFFYLVYLAGMLWSKNMDYGGIDLQIKLSLLIFPLLFGAISHPFDTKQIKSVLLAFVTGCFIATAICFAHAIYSWATLNEYNFTYTQLTVFIHPSYFAMYLSFAISILIYFLSLGKPITGKSLIDTILVIWFWFFIIMLQSKAGILITALIFILFFIKHVTTKNKVTLSLISIVLLAGIYFMTNKYIITYAYSRINIAEHIIAEAKVDTTSKESNQVRILIWKASSEIIKDNFLFGTGTGDVKDELMKKYKEKGMTGAFEHNLNAHDQYIQTFITLGIIGIISLLSLFATGFWQGFKQKKWIYTCLLIILFLNFIPESMLEVQAGVLFYAFFNSLLLFAEEEKL